jgi:hypothetical protein
LYFQMAAAARAVVALPSGSRSAGSASPEAGGRAGHGSSIGTGSECDPVTAPDRNAQGDAEYR